MYMAGLMDSLEELQRELAEADELIAELSRTEPRPAFTPEHLESLVKDFPSYWAKAGVVDRRQLLLAVSPRIVISSRWGCHQPHLSHHRTCRSAYGGSR
jgi:hypothetical protein